MNNDIEIQTLTKLHNLRRKLQDISNISFAFKELNGSHPIHGLNEQTAGQLIEAYESLLEETK